MTEQTSDDHDSAVTKPDFSTVQVNGVGGWLLLFVIGQLALRPMLFLASFLTATPRTDLAARFPATAKLVTIEAAIQIALLIAGIIVGLALLKKGVGWPVLMAKMYLVANATLNLGLAVLYFGSDLPEVARTSLIVKGIISGAVVAIVSCLWFLYFTRSKRVQATYYPL